MPKKSYRQAINEAIRQEMERDPRVIMIGEDVSGGAGAPGEQDAWGGPLGVTKGLMPQFGRERVLDTPITEFGLHRSRDRRRRDRAAADRRPDVRRFHGRLFRPDLQSGRQVPLHVRRQGGDPGGHPHHVRRRFPRGVAALAVPLSPLHPHPGPQGGAAVQPLRGEGLDDPGDPGRRSGHRVRTQDVVRRRGRSAGRALCDPVRRGQRDPRRARRYDHHDGSDGQSRQRGRRQSRQERREDDSGRPSHDLAARSRNGAGDCAGDRPRGRGGRVPTRGARWPPTSRRWWRTKSLVR